MNAAEMGQERSEDTAGGEEVIGWADDPDNYCIGCSAANPRALGLRFVRHGSGVQGQYTAARELNGAPGVVHGGIQAAMLDEAMGHAIRAAMDQDAWPVTVDLRLRYRRPVPTEVPLLLRAEVVEHEGHTLHLRAEILGEDEQVLTRATAEFRLLDRSEA